MKVLLIGNREDSYYEKAVSIAKSRNIDIEHIRDEESALRTISMGHNFDVLMLDVALDVENFMNRMREERLYLNVVACGYDDEHSRIVSAIKYGAKEYISLPPDADMMVDILETFVGDSIDNIVSKSSMMNKVLDMVYKISESDANVLITGESGTGKEVMARLLHKRSYRKDKEFVSVNCAAIPEALMESELFGHEKGAFTGAFNRRIGKFESAHNGTLLLDEISEMNLCLQAKLLRALQEREITRVGSNKIIKLDIRILATSNRNLLTEVREGRFREDLYFRLNVINIKLPSLRERLEDIPSLVNIFIHKYCKLNGLSKKTVNLQAIKSLQNYKWTGNIRELENVVHRAVLMSDGDQIVDFDLPTNVSHDVQEEDMQDTDNMLVGQTLGSMEEKFIKGTIKYCDGNKTRAAKVLGISIRTLRNKLKAYNNASI